MADNPRVAWTIAYDAGSARMRNNDFTQLSVKECKPSFVDDTRVLVKLHLEKRMRSNPVVEELRRLLRTGRIQRAWIQKRPGTAYDKIDIMAHVDDETIELERIDGAEHEDTAAAKSKQKKKKQHKAAARSASTTPLLANEPRAQRAKSSEEDDNEEEDEEEDIEEEEDDQEDQSADENEEDDNAQIKTLIASCMKDIQKRMKQLEQEVRAQKRTKNHHHHASDPKPKPTGPARKKEFPKPEMLPTWGRIKLRTPILLSWLKTATVSELYYAGLWFPNHDVDDKIDPPPLRDACFRSELLGMKEEGEYIENYDIDDLLHPDLSSPYLKDKSAALKRTHYEHFVDHRPRGAIALYELRRYPYNILHQLQVISLDYDIDDVNPPVEWSEERPPRKRLNCDQVRTLYRYGPYDGLEPVFIKGYDIDETKMEETRTETTGLVTDWKHKQAERRTKATTKLQVRSPTASP
jgi:hypothetical protein